MRLKIVFSLLSLVLFQCFAFADTRGKITSVLSNTDLPNLVFIQVEGHNPTQHVCQTNSDWNHVIDVSTETGKSQLSIVLAAHMSGTDVEVSNKDCSLYSDVQTLRYIFTVM